ncbi:MAG: PAS domain-containing protein [Gammaproteobacteria bacterium]|nr:PAS domain-containing protein [Gammaproteobacteria bacterium]
MKTPPQDAERLAVGEVPEQFAALLPTADCGFWRFDALRDEIQWFGEWCDAVDIDPCLGPGHTARWAAQIHAEDGLPIAQFRELLAGRLETYEAEYRLRTRAGAWRWVLTRARAIERGADGRVLRVAGVTLDIDARKRAELQLRETEARLEAAVWGTQIGVWENPPEGGFRWLNDWCRTLDIDPCDGADYSECWRAQIHPDDRARVEQAWDPFKSSRAGHYVVEYRMRTRAGRWHWIHERGKVTSRDADGRANAYVGVCMDIDARKRMELALQSQARILETMREGVVLIGAGGRIEYVNPAFERMLGAGPGALIGRRPVDLLEARIHGRNRRQAVERLLRRASASGGSRTVLLRRADHSHFTAEVVAVEIAVDGETKIACVIQDVTERTRLEHEITEVAHAEQRRLGAELHDGLGQELTGISLLLRAIVPRIAVALPQSAPQLDEIIVHVNKAIDSTRRMAHGLAPVSLGRGGLIAALEALAQRMRGDGAVEVRLRLGLRCPLRIDEASATHLYLIAQEAVTRACGPARARRVTITLRVNRLFFTLAVVDDGESVEATATDEASLRILHYRAGAIGGSLRIQPRRQGGTRVRCVCPHAAPTGD